jgi:hypothetical protein
VPPHKFVGRHLSIVSKDLVNVIWGMRPTIDLKMEAVSTSETSVNISEDSHLQVAQLHDSPTFWFRSTVVGANLYVQRSLQAKGKGIIGVADEAAYTVQTININSQWQYFVARCLSCCDGDVFALHSTCVCFPSTPTLVT